MAPAAAFHVKPTCALAGVAARPVGVAGAVAAALSTSTKSFCPALLLDGDVKVWFPVFARLVPIVTKFPLVGSYHRAVTGPANWLMCTVKLWPPPPLGGL